MTVALDSVRSDLAALVGVAQLKTDPRDCAALAVDGKVPDWVASPCTAEQVAALLHYAGEHRLALIPCGMGTKLATGNLPRQYDGALSVREMKKVVHYEPADLTITVEAGMTLGEFQRLTGRDRLWLPLDPRGGSQATVGGIIAANAAGPLRQGFGGPRDMVLGLKIATTDGHVAKTGGRVVKNVAGYDFGKLLTGSLGTLGVIVEASLKLFPQPPGRTTFSARLPDLTMARNLRRSLLRSPLDPMRMILLDPAARALLDDAPSPRQPGFELWIEVGGSQRVRERCGQELSRLATAVGSALAESENPELTWARIADLAAWLQPRCNEITVLKAAIPAASSEEFLILAQREAEQNAIPVASFAQVGLGIVHLCALPESLTLDQVKFVTRLRKGAEYLGGTLVIEHCPTELKSHIDVWGTGDVAAVMRKLKLAWDPNEVLSPGRFVGF